MTSTRPSCSGQPVQGCSASARKPCPATEDTTAERKHEMHEQMLEIYYAHNARRLHRTVDRILMRFGGLSYADTDDFYSLANEVFTDVMGRYDGTGSFEGFLHSCLARKIMSEITRRNRKKRQADRMAMSLDAPVGSGDGCTFMELVSSDSDPRDQISAGHVFSHKMECYLGRLSSGERDVLELLSYSYGADEIREMLHISRREYTDALEGIRCYENIRILF